jgi:quercetin dioxygenase-like cupin family protein
MPTAFVVTPATAPAPLNVVGEHITVLASGAQTGSYEIFRQAGPEGGGPPPHFHPWDESFYVVKGEIAFGVGDKVMIAEPGTPGASACGNDALVPLRQGWRRDDFYDIA